MQGFPKCGHNLAGICGAVAAQVLYYALPLTADACTSGFSCREVPEAVSFWEEKAKS